MTVVYHVQFQTVSYCTLALRDPIIRGNTWLIDDCQHGENKSMYLLPWEGLIVLLEIYTDNTNRYSTYDNYSTCSAVLDARLGWSGILLMYMNMYINRDDFHRRLASADYQHLNFHYVWRCRKWVLASVFAPCFGSLFAIMVTYIYACASKHYRFCSVQAPALYYLCE
jgi:hypothetical protein